MSVQEDLLRLRARMNDLLSMGVIEGDSAGTYQQTLLQILQEAESRRAQCEQLSHSLEVQLHQARAQATAFGMVGQLMYAVVNGMASKEEQRLREIQEREKEKRESEESGEGVASEPGTDPSPAETPKRRGKPKGTSGADP